MQLTSGYSRGPRFASREQAEAYRRHVRAEVDALRADASDPAPAVDESPPAKVLASSGA